MSSSYGHRASESSESGLLDYTYENTREDYTGIMARLHPPYVVEAEAIGVRERVEDPKRYWLCVDSKDAAGYLYGGFNAASIAANRISSVHMSLLCVHFGGCTLILSYKGQNTTH